VDNTNQRFEQPSPDTLFMPTNKSFGLVVSDDTFKISASQKQEFPIGPVLKVLFEK